MSKYLVKILSICALVILLAVTIVGAAICVSEAVGCTLTIVDAGDKSTGADSSVAIYIDGKKQEGDKVHVSKYTEVTIKYEGAGYDFVGWYEGQYDKSKDKAVSESTSYKFEVKKNTKMTAEANLKTYNVTFTGFLADGTTPVTEEISENQVFKYGEELPKLSTDLDLYLQGWNVVGEETTEATNYLYAQFAQSEVTVKPNWGAQEYVDYTVNVAYNKRALDDKTTLIYNTKNGFEKYTRTRDCYTLTGIEFNGRSFAYNSATESFTGLAEAIVRNGVTEVNAVALWECEYNSIEFKINGVAKYSTEDLDFGYNGLKAKQNGELKRMEDKFNATFTDEEGRDNFDLMENLYAYFVGIFTDYQTIDGRAVEFANKVIISVNGTNIEYTYNLLPSANPVVTFKDILTSVEHKNGDTMDGVTGITLSFEFELVA